MRAFLWAALAVMVALCLIAWTKQQNVDSAWNQTQAMRTGIMGSALNAAMPATWDAAGTPGAVNVACSATVADLSGSTDATADLACLNTGDIVTTLWEQITISAEYTYAAGTALTMQCDYSQNQGTTWAPVPDESSAGALTVRNWTVASPGSGTVLTANFDIDYELVRCRIWATSGNTSDKVAFRITLAR